VRIAFVERWTTVEGNNSVFIEKSPGDRPAWLTRTPFARVI
jgi:hypothetical protein